MLPDGRFYGWFTLKIADSTCCRLRFQWAVGKLKWNQREQEGIDMFEIDKTQFGEFLASQRKRKGYTQKELAQKLFISDKAVSKWERGV